MQDAIRYTISVDDPRTHRFKVRIDIAATGAPMRISMPSWSPGSYLLREFARQVISLSAMGANGVALPCRKTARGTWLVEPEAAGSVCVEYTLNAQERSVRTPYLDSELGFFVGTNVFMFVEGLEDRRAEVRFELPQGWVVHCSRIDGFTGKHFAARHYDELADSAVAMVPAEAHGGPAVHRFEVCGKPHGFVAIGDGRLDLDQVVLDTQKVVGSAAALFGDGELPYERYLFIQIFTEHGRGGLEHLDSCALAFPRARYRSRDDHIDFMLLVAHEFFHVWNIKRVHTDVLGPFDYTAENYTRDLWVGEGWTTYFQNHIVRHAGIIDGDKLLEIFDKRLAAHEKKPGRHVQSLEESSFDAWIKLYRADADSPNTTVSYYLKGSLVALLLDLEIRRRTGDRQSLFDVFAYLWREFGQHGVGYPEATVQQQVETVVGGDWTQWFDRYVRGTAPLDWDEVLAHVGLRRVEVPREDAPPSIGVTISSGDGLTLATVYADGPARACGLMTGDTLVALDRYRIEPHKLDELLRTFAPGDTLEVTYFREGQLRSTEVTLEGAKPGYKIERIEAAGEAQQRALARFLHEATG